MYTGEEPAHLAPFSTLKMPESARTLLGKISQNLLERCMQFTAEISCCAALKT